VVTAEYNGLSRTAYIAENDEFYDIICNNVKMFVHIIFLLKKRYGEFEYGGIGNHIVFVSFVEA